METVTTRNTRKAKEKALAKFTPPRNLVKKNRDALQVKPKIIDISEFKLSDCVVVLKRNPEKPLQSPSRRLYQAEHIYDFEETPSQEDNGAANVSIDDIYKKLESKNIVKILGRKPKVEKQKKAKAIAKPKATQKKRKAAATSVTKSSVTTRNRKGHNLNDVATETIASSENDVNVIVNDNNSDENFASHSVCAGIIDQDGNGIGLIENEWSKAPTYCSQQKIVPNIPAGKFEMNNDILATCNAIESFEIIENIRKNKEIPINAHSSPTYSLPPDFQDSSWAPEDLVDDSPIKRSLRLRAEKKPVQSTPLPYSRSTAAASRFSRSAIFANASPLLHNASSSVAPVPVHLDVSAVDKNRSIEIINIDTLGDGPENAAMPNEKNTPNADKQRLQVYSVRNALKNIVS